MTTVNTSTTPSKSERALQSAGTQNQTKMKKIQLSPSNAAMLAALERGETLTNREISRIRQNLTRLLKFIDSVRFDELPENWVRDAQTETGRIVAILEKSHFDEIER